MSFGYDDELPGGYQDADLEMAELEREGNRLARAAKPTAVITRLDGRKMHVVIQREHDGWYWATNGQENSDRGYTLRANGEARRERYKNGERLTSDPFGTWAMS